MRIGVVGAGSVGGTLGRGWARAGHEVCFGTRRAADAKLKQLVAESAPRARSGSLAEAVGFGEVVLLATPWGATREVLAGLGGLAGKILLDATNPLLPGLRGLDHADGRSGGEQVAAWASGARVVKIFNTTGFNVMAAPRFGSERASMLHCGDDAAAKRAAAQLAIDLGFEPIDAGPLAEARWLETFAMLWIRLAMVHGHGREIAFRLMRR